MQKLTQKFLRIWQQGQQHTGSCVLAQVTHTHVASPRHYCGWFQNHSLWETLGQRTQATEFSQPSSDRAGYSAPPSISDQSRAWARSTLSAMMSGVVRVVFSKVRPQYSGLVAVLALCDREAGYGLQFGYSVSERFSVPSLGLGCFIWDFYLEQRDVVTGNRYAQVVRM